MANILFVLPFYSGDKGQAERLGKWILALSKGNKINANALLVASYDTNANDILPLYRQCFNGAASIQQQIAPELTTERAWPQACNLQFLSVAEYIVSNDSFAKFDAFYYFEPDNLPLRADWWDVICAEYEGCRKSFWGVKATNIEHQGDKSWEDGFHMIGTGIYPRDAYTRIAKFDEIRRKNPSRPWDVLARESVNPQCHFTDLIVNLHNSHGFRMDEDKLTAVNREPLEPDFNRKEVKSLNQAAVFHGCKDASLRLLMAKKLDIVLTDRLSFLHRGELGDLVYAMASIKNLGGGDIKLDIRAHPPAEGTAESRHASIVPLMEAQDYISSVSKHEGSYVDYDFTSFRLLLKDYPNLAQAQAEWVGADPACINEPWLKPSVTNRKSSGIVTNRTNRYHREGFPWKNIVEVFGASLSFIGSDQEHYEFCEDFGVVKRAPVSHLMEICDLIALSERFIGNQSCCFAIAEGLKHPRIQETWDGSKDCLFESASGLYDTNEIPNAAFEKTEWKSLPNPNWTSSLRVETMMTLESGGQTLIEGRELHDLIREAFLTNRKFASFLRNLVNPPKIDKRRKAYRKQKAALCSK